MKRKEVLKKADKYINGDRAKDYGNAFENFTRISEGWQLIIREANATTGYVTPRHVALLMIWLKMARLLHDLDNDDSWVDIAGYAALGAECTDNESEIQKRLALFMRDSKKEPQTETER
jgi:hypothetical protein